MEFFVVYIREAHASNSRRPDRETNVKDPTTIGERLRVATTCREDLGLKLPMLIDDMRNSTDAAYSGWPDRLYLVDTQGKIAYRGDRGPRGFRTSELGDAIQALLKKTPAKKRTPEELEVLREKLRARRKASIGKN